MTHDAFGLGAVAEVDGAGEKAAASIDFVGEYGLKRFVLYCAPSKNPSHPVRWR